jgi:hypothetical protein
LDIFHDWGDIFQSILLKRRGVSETAALNSDTRANYSMGLERNNVSWFYPNALGSEFRSLKLTIQKHRKQDIYEARRQFAGRAESRRYGSIYYGFFSPPYDASRYVVCGSAASVWTGKGSGNSQICI